MPGLSKNIWHHEQRCSTQDHKAPGQPQKCYKYSTFHKSEFGVLCCLTTPGLRKDIRRHKSEQPVW